MQPDCFQAPNGTAVPAVTTAEMREVDRVAVEEVGLDLIQMMEHAGRGLAEAVLGMRRREPVSVVAGNGGNGGGGLACARHLANRDVPVRVVLDRDAAAIDGPPAQQLRILQAMDVPVAAPAEPTIDGLAVDALIGYGLTEAPRGRAPDLIATMNGADRALSLDVPTGRDATTGDRPGPAVSPDLTVTLALPKTGLATVPGDLRLVDLSIPATVYRRVGVDYAAPFGEDFAIDLVRVGETD